MVTLCLFAIDHSSYGPYDHICSRLASLYIFICSLLVLICQAFILMLDTGMDKKYQRTYLKDLSTILGLFDNNGANVHECYFKPHGSHFHQFGSAIYGKKSGFYLQMDSNNIGFSSFNLGISSEELPFHEKVKVFCHMAERIVC